MVIGYPVLLQLREYLIFVIFQQGPDAGEQIPQQPVSQPLQTALQLYQDWHNALHQMLFHHRRYLPRTCSFDHSSQFISSKDFPAILSPVLQSM